MYGKNERKVQVCVFVVTILWSVYIATLCTGRSMAGIDTSLMTGLMLNASSKSPGEKLEASWGGVDVSVGAFLRLHILWWRVRLYCLVKVEAHIRQTKLVSLCAE